MKIRTFTISFFAALLILAAANLVLGHYLRDAERKIELYREKIHELDDDLQDLILSSQWATRFARTYIVTRNPKRFEWYNQITDILDGKIARPEKYNFEYWDMVAGGFAAEPDVTKVHALSIEDRFLKIEATSPELTKLREALALLVKMAATELIAMHAANGEFEDGNGSFQKKGRPDFEMAKKMLFSDAYNKDNAELSHTVSTLKESITSRFSLEISNQTMLINQLLVLNSYMAFAVFALVSLSVAYLRYRFFARARKIMQVVGRIAVGDFKFRTEITGNDELSEMAKIIDQMQINLVDTVESSSQLANDVAAGSEQLQSAVVRVSEGVNNQASSVQETAAAMEQIAANIRQNAEASSRTQKTSIRIAEDARTCAQAMQRTAIAMKDIADKSMAVEEITRKIELLALNASVEAARAGEHGKGFAVVASEVSKLADLSKQATSAIRLSSIEGKDTAEETNMMLINLVPEIERAKDLIQGISVASEEQATGAQQVNVAVRRLDEVTQFNASAATEMAATAHALAEHAANLKNAISWFQSDGKKADNIDLKFSNKENKEQNHPLIKTLRGSDLGKY